MWRAQRERQVRLQHQRHPGGADAGSEGVDPAVVARLLIERWRVVAGGELPRVNPEYRYLRQHIRISAGDVLDVLLRGLLSSTVRDPGAKPRRPGPKGDSR